MVVKSQALQSLWVINDPKHPQKYAAKTQARIHRPSRYQNLGHEREEQLVSTRPRLGESQQTIIPFLDEDHLRGNSTYYIPVVPHKAVAEVSKIGNL